MIYFLITTTFAQTLYFDIQKGNVITKEEHSNMFCKDILANLPPYGELHTGHFHILDTLFQQDIIVERQEFERVTEEQIDELYEQVKMSNMLIMLKFLAPLNIIAQITYGKKKMVAQDR